MPLFGRRQEPSTIFNPGHQDGDTETFGRQPMIGLRMNFKHRIVFALNVGQILTAVPCIVVGSVAIVMECTLAKLGVPLWCGLLFLAAGMQGVIAARKKNTLMVMAALILSIVASAGSLAVLVTAIYALFRDSTYKNCNMYTDCVPAGCVVGDMIVLVSGVAECACAVITVMLCSQAVCRCKRNKYRSGRPYIVLNNSEPQPLLSGVHGTPAMAGTIVVDPGGRATSNGHLQSSTANDTASDFFQPMTLSPSELPVHSGGTGSWLTARNNRSPANTHRNRRKDEVNEGFETEDSYPEHDVSHTVNLDKNKTSELIDSTC